MSVTIYHNPNCGTSRNTLAIIRASGEEPVVIEYVQNPPSRERLVELLTAMQMSVRLTHLMGNTLPLTFVRSCSQAALRNHAFTT